jgi:hypothetical protein
MAELTLAREETVTLGRESPGLTQVWNVIGYADRASAKAALILGTPNVLDGLLRNSATMEFVDEGTYTGTIGYGLLPLPEQGEVSFSASTKGGTATVTQAIDTYDAVAIAGFTPPDTYGAIGLDADGNVSGVSVTVPKATFSLEIHLDFDAITDTYWSYLESITGMVNAKKFKGRKPHDVEFLGADFDGTTRMGTDDQALARLRFDFLAEPSRLRSDSNGIAIPGLERDIDKRGHDYLEIRYGEFIDDDSKAKVRRPVAAWSRQVKPAANFAKIGIGT